MVKYGEIEKDCRKRKLRIDLCEREEERMRKRG